MVVPVMFTLSADICTPSGATLIRDSIVALPPACLSEGDAPVLVALIRTLSAVCFIVVLYASTASPVTNLHPQISTVPAVLARKYALNQTRFVSVFNAPSVVNVAVHFFHLSVNSIISVEPTDVPPFNLEY